MGLEQACKSYEGGLVALRALSDARHAPDAPLAVDEAGFKAYSL
jgi:hypothetical protein